MIAELAFERSPARVRRARFARRPAIPVEAACVVANGIREALRTLLGDARLTIGEPVAIDALAWRALMRDALVFVTPGRVTDVIFAIGRGDARALVRAAFGEEHVVHDATWSALESGAIERIIARCAGGVDCLCAERRGLTRAAEPAQIPACVAFFDVRVAAPVAVTIGVGIVRELPMPVPAGSLGAPMIGRIEADLRVVVGRAAIPASRMLALRVGDVIGFATKVDGDGELNLAGQRIALGSCGAVNGRAAFEVRSTCTRGDGP